MTLALLGLSLCSCTSAGGDIDVTASASVVSTSPTSPSSGTTAPSASTSSTSTTVVTVTSNLSTGPPTTKLAGCRRDPFARPFPEQIAALYPGKRITAHVFDTRTGCSYGLNPGSRQPTASVFKVMVMAGTLHEAQMQGRDLTERELGLLTPMITGSTNPQVRTLWRSFGSSPWFRRQAEYFGLEETSITADGGSAWGLTKTSASDQVKLIREVLLGEGELLEPAYRAEALRLMTSVVPEQTWGITAGVPSLWVVAQKNGFAGATINSVGWVDEPGDGDGYVVAILSTGWPNFTAGIAAVEFVNQAIADAMFDTIQGVE